MQAIREPNPRYDRAYTLAYLSIPGTDPWVSTEELIERGKKAAIGAAIRTKIHLANHLRNLDAQAAQIEAALLQGKPRPESLWHFNKDRHAVVRWALIEADAELIALQAHPDAFWRGQRRQHFTVYTQSTNSWRSI